MTDRPKPVNFRERTNQVLPVHNNQLQLYIQDIEKYAVENRMVINKKKTQIMIFNKSQKWDFPPEIHFNDGQQLEVISEAKLVGLMMSDNLSWHKNTAFICKRARTKLWILRRMINLNLSDDQIYDVY